MDEMSDVCGENCVLVEQLARTTIGPEEEEGEAGSGVKRSGKKRKEKRPEMIRMRSLERSSESAKGERPSNAEFQEYELADDAIDELEGDASGGNVEGQPRRDEVSGQEQEAEEEDDFERIGCDSSDTSRKTVGREELPVGVPNSTSIDTAVVILRGAAAVAGKFATFPRMKRRRRVFTNRISLKHGKVRARATAVPTRTTKDGTSIFYWCDVNGGRPIKGEFCCRGRFKWKGFGLGMRVQMDLVFRHELLLIGFIFCRAGRRCLQSDMDEPGVHAKLSLLEGEQAPVIDATERTTDLCQPALVEYSQRFAG